MEENNTDEVKVSEEIKTEENNDFFTLRNLKENLSVIVLFTSFAGGFGQFVNLASLSSDFLVFFSTSQLLSRGVFFIVFLLINTFIMFLLALPLIIVNKKWAIVSVAILLIGILIFISESIDVFPFVITPIIFTSYFAVLRLKNVFNLFDEQNELDSDNKNANKILMDSLDKFGLVIIIMVYIINYELKQDLDTPKNLSESICKKDDIRNCYELEYYNDKYAFYKNYQNEIIVKNIDELLDEELYEDKIQLTNNIRINQINDSILYERKLFVEDSIHNVEMDSLMNALEESIKENYNYNYDN